ncbi:MAG: DUF2846 domain-containing protein [Deltaproteobacteria bacterium]|nr:DUF2846 domain-containing protein [Deltaproteobacteria bacterium]
MTGVERLTTMYALKSWIAAVLLLLLGGCATARDPGFGGWMSPKPGLGVVVLYRPWSFVGGLLPVRVQVDGERRPDLENGTHQVHELPPGDHTIVTKMGSLAMTTDTITIDVKVVAGSVLYARFAAHRKDVGGGTMVRTTELTVVNEDTARREIPDTKRAN